MTPTPNFHKKNKRPPGPVLPIKRRRISSRVGDRQPPFLATVLLLGWATKVSVDVGSVFKCCCEISEFLKVMFVPLDLCFPDCLAGFVFENLIFDPLGDPAE